MLAAIKDQARLAVPVRRMEVRLIVAFGGTLVTAAGDPRVRWLAMMAKNHHAWLYPYMASG
ncbi:hypothetical protein IGA63_02135 [Pseudomonas aeruginosa]|uniref:hypothetical protein n=1 Tax=Pseudomonas aeruginosa TaxID=287 RepID=UPI0012BF1697|nr:hypothetical protein F7O87_02180 [Pseudomonas aeruginosa]MCW5507926.1 hypothetical protein [Pseudomonas aeruginosa]